MRSKKLCALIAVLAVICLLLAACTDVPKITGFRIDTSEMKLEYEKGEAADFSKLKVEAVYSDKTVKALTRGESGYTLELGDYDKDVVGEYLITVKYKTYEAKTFRIKVKESETPPIAIPTVTEIKIKTKPKTEYENDEDLDLTGLVVQKVMSDETKVDLTETEYTINTAAYDKTKAGTYTITVTLKADETKTASFNVTVKAPIPTLTGIEIKTAPKTEYENGEDLDLTGLVVQKVMSDGTKADLTATEYTVDTAAYDKTKAGTYAITVTLVADETKTVSFNVTVKEAVPTVTYSIQSMPRTAFLEGEDFNAFGLVVARTDASGTTTLESSDFDVDFSAYNGSVAGRYEIVIRVKELTAANAPRNANSAVSSNVLKYTVSVSAVQLNLAHVKRNYREGEPLDTTNLTVALVDADGQETPLTEGTDYFVDETSYFPWFENNKGARKIKIVVKDYPDFPLYYDYYMNQAAVRSAEIDWSRTSSVLPYGYAPDEKDSDAVGVSWKGIDVNGKSASGNFRYIDNYPNDDLRWERPLDTTVPGVYRLTFGARTSETDEPIVLSMDVTVLEQDAPYVTSIGASESGDRVTLPYGEPINLENFKVRLQMSDGTHRETTLSETEFIIEYRNGGTALSYELKHGFKPNYSKLADGFNIDYFAKEPILDGIRADADGQDNNNLTKTDGNDFTGYLKLPGVEYTLSPIVYGGYGKFTILSINGVPFEDPDFKNPNGFIWDGGNTVIDYQIEMDGSGVPIKGAIYLFPDPDFIFPDSVLELEIDGVKQTPYYDAREADRVVLANISYVIPKVKTELPIRFRLLKDGYRLSFRNDTEDYALSDTETTYYYLNADDNSGMFVHYTLISLESGNAIVDGTISFRMETMITSFIYDGDEIIGDNGSYSIRIMTAPQLQKLSVSLVSGYTYKIYDFIGNEILSDAQLLQVLNSDIGLSLKVYDADGVLYETHSLGFEIEDKVYYERYYYEQIESPEYESYGGNLELFADGNMFQISPYECFRLEQLQNRNWSMFDRNNGYTVSSAVFAFYDKEGNAVDLANVNVLYDTFYFRATYTLYGMYREWDSETGEEKAIFNEITKTAQWAFRFTSIADLPGVYIEMFGIAPVPIDMGGNVDRFETFVWAFRTDVVTKDSFGVRFRPEYRDIITMTVEDAGSDRFLAKFFIEGGLVTFLYVDVARAGLVNADTYADFTYENLTDGTTSFAKFKNGEAYLTMSVGSYINVLTSNEWASTSVAEEIEGINTDYLATRYGAKQIVLTKEGIYTVTITVTSTDKTATEDYVLHIYTKPETPLFSTSIAGKEYYAKVSEIMSQSDGDFTMQEHFGVIYLRERLKASELGDAYNAALNTLKLAVNAEGETVIYELNENFDPISEAIAKGEEHAFTLIDLTLTGEPEFEGAHGALIMIHNTESDQYFPVIIVVDLAL